MTFCLSLPGAAAKGRLLRMIQNEVMAESGCVVFMLYKCHKLTQHSQHAACILEAPGYHPPMSDSEDVTAFMFLDFVKTAFGGGHRPASTSTRRSTDASVDSPVFSLGPHEP